MSETPAGDALAVEPAAQEQPAPETQDDGAPTTPETTTDEAKEEQFTEAKEDDDQDEPEEPKRKRLSGSERLRRENERLRAELASRSAPAAGELDSQEAIMREAERRAGPQPKEEDFKGDFLKYERKLLAWELRVEGKAEEITKEVTSAKQAKTTAMREAIADHQDRVAELVKSHPELRAKFNEPLPVVPNNTVREVLLDSDKSHLLLKYFYDNPRAVAELNSLESERAVALRIGKLEGRVSPPKPKPTQAPPPIKPPTGTARPGFDPFKASTAEIAKHLKAKGQMY